MIKKILYYLPFVLFSSFIIFIGNVDSFYRIELTAWLYIAMLFVAGFLMCEDIWWGCSLGILYGIALIFMGFRETGQLINETPFGIIICIYYAYLGRDLYKKK